MFGDFLNRGKHGQLDFENIDDLEDGTPIVARYNNREFQFGIYGEGYVIYQDCWQTKAGVLVFSLEQSSIEGFFEDSTVYEYTPDFEFDKKKAELDSQKKELNAKQKTIEQNSNSIASKKASLATDRAESDRLLAELTAQNKQYTEFRNEDSALIEQVESEIQAVISGVKPPDEITTAVAGKTSQKVEAIDQSKSDVYSKSDAVLNMKYPVPGKHGISAGFPNYSSGKYHGGIDFPCATGSKVVAAQKGVVITVKRLNYSYGYYIMIYHGTDSQGRSVVTLYAHNSSILVSPGDTVKKGETIAKSGSTGNSTGPHCHFEVRLNGSRVNPKNYLS